MRELDLEIGDLVEVDGRCYEVVPDGAGGVTFEPAIKPKSEPPNEHGAPPVAVHIAVGAQPRDDREDDEAAQLRAAIEHVQGSVADLAPNRSLVDELIADRRREARAEDREAEEEARRRNCRDPRLT